MAVSKFANGSMFVPIRSGHACPVCGSKKGRCAEYYSEDGIRIFYRCKYKISDKPSNGWYIHMVSDIDGYDPNEKPAVILPNIEEETELTPEILEIRDKVYRRFRELVRKFEGSYLYPEDMKDLTDRGLNEFQIRRMGFFSVPTSEKMVWNPDGGSYKVKVVTAISKVLEKEFGINLLKVPGFTKKKDKKGNEFIAFKTSRVDLQTEKYVPIKGYFIPYVNVQGLVEALQYRLTIPMYDEKGKIMRYFWYSSKQARSGSPINYYIPNTVNRDGVILITEGATKGKIACEKLGYEGLFEAGVGNYRRLVNELITLEKLIGKRYKVLLALDMDKYTIIDDAGKYPVLDAETQTISSLKATGHQVAVMEWDISKGKGIDDSIIANASYSYKLF